MGCCASSENCDCALSIETSFKPHTHTENEILGVPKHLHPAGCIEGLEAEVCRITTEVCPPSVTDPYNHPPLQAVDNQPGTGCCRLIHDGNVVDLGASYNSVRAGRGPATDIVRGKVAGQPIANSQITASISVGCCQGGLIRIDHWHSMTPREGFDSAIALVPEYQVDGGGWLPFGTAGRDELCMLDGPAYFCLGEFEFFDTRFVSVSPGTHTIDTRLLYLGVIEGTWTTGIVSPNSATLVLSTVEVNCC